MAGRARLSPYYFVTGETAELAGILATICPADKKVIHGMKDAVMVPCAVDGRADRHCQSSYLSLYVDDPLSCPLVSGM